MKIIQRIPTAQYSYIEFEDEYENVGEALVANAELCKRYEDPGLPDHKWAGVRNKMFSTGQFDPNIEGLSKAQRYFVNQCKLALRALKEDNDPVIN
jgi:hypothetical protein